MHESALAILDALAAMDVFDPTQQIRDEHLLPTGKLMQRVNDRAFHWECAWLKLQLREATTWEAVDQAVRESIGFMQQEIMDALADSVGMDLEASELVPARAKARLLRWLQGHALPIVEQHRSCPAWGQVWIVLGSHCSEIDVTLEVVGVTATAEKAQALCEELQAQAESPQTTYHYQSFVIDAPDLGA